MSTYMRCARSAFADSLLYKRYFLSKRSCVSEIAGYYENKPGATGQTKETQ